MTQKSKLKRLSPKENLINLVALNSILSSIKRRRLWPLLLLAPVFLPLAFFPACRQEVTVIKAAGVVDGETALVIAPVAGEITEFNLVEGKSVAKGEVAALVDASKIKIKIDGLEIAARNLRVNQAKTERQIAFLLKNKEYWQDQVTRLKKLAEAQAVTGDELRRAKLQLEETETELDLARRTLESLRLEEASLENQREELELQLKDFSLLVPADGTVIETFVTAGERVMPGKVLARLLVKGSLFIETFLEEAELGRIKLNQEARFEVDGLPGKEFKAEVTYINREAEFSPKYIISEKERKALLYQVKIKPLEAEEILKLGMPVTVIIQPVSPGNAEGVNATRKEN